MLPVAKPCETEWKMWTLSPCLYSYPSIHGKCYTNELSVGQIHQHPKVGCQLGKNKHLHAVILCKPYDFWLIMSNVSIHEPDQWTCCRCMLKKLVVKEYQLIHPFGLVPCMLPGTSPSDHWWWNGMPSCTTTAYSSDLHLVTTVVAPSSDLCVYKLVA